HEGHTAAVKAAAFSPNAALIASGGADKSVRIWNAADGKPLLTLQGHTGEVESLAFTSDNTKLVSSGSDGQIIVWDAKTGQQLQQFAGGAPTTVVTVAPDNLTIFPAAADKNVKQFGIASPVPKNYAGHGDIVDAVTVSPDSTKIASASY